MITKKENTEFNYKEELAGAVELLSRRGDNETNLLHLCPEGLPSLSNVKEMISLLWKLFFPELFYDRSSVVSRPEYRIGITTDRLYQLLQDEISIGLSCIKENDVHPYKIANQGAAKLASIIICQLPELKRKLFNDIYAIMKNDPAAGNEVEIILCYPSVKAMLHYRLANLISTMKIPYFPRIISEIAHSQTGIDIHPGANIGEFFAIDHGTGVVIGETCVIGNNVTIYQGVTLGAKNFKYNDEGVPLNIPRHPIIEDNVTIYSNASVLGRITIGHDSIIGGNVWVTEDVMPYSRILQGISRNETFKDGSGI